MCDLLLDLLPVPHIIFGLIRITSWKKITFALGKRRSHLRFGSAGRGQDSPGKSSNKGQLPEAGLL